MGRRWLLCLLCASACYQGDDDGGYHGTRPDARHYMDAAIDACIPLTCATAGASCGTIADDGCGTPLDCGTCADPATCGGQGAENVCAIPTAERACVAGWCWESPAPMPFDPASMFARADNDVWAAGNRGTVMHWDGTTWRTVSANTTEDLYDIWMASATDGWLVGANGTIRRWNGTTWNTVASGTTAALRGVCGFSPTEVWIVGDGVSRRWNGSTLATPIATSTPSLYDVYVPTSGKPFAVGQGRVWAYTGVTWSAQTSDAPTLKSYTLQHIAGTASNVYAVGRERGLTSGEELIYHWNGTSWARVEHPGDPEFTDAFVAGGAIYGVTDESIIDLDTFARTVGPDATTLAATGTPARKFFATTGGLLWSGTLGVWKSAGFGPRDHLTAIGAVGDGVWFGGAHGRLLEWRDGFVVHEPPTTYSIRAIAGPARDDVWIVDDFTRLLHFDGVAWRNISPAPFVRAQTLHASATEVVLLGTGIYHRAGTDWEEEPVAGASGVTWVAVAEHAGDLFAVGYGDGTTPHVAHRANGTWTELPAPAVPELCGIAVAAADDIWVTGNDGVGYPDKPTGMVAHWDGSAWTTTTLAGTEEPCAIAIHDGEVFVGGTPNDIQHRLANGTWTVERPTPLGPINALAATSTALWAAGEYGAVLKR